VCGERNADRSAHHCAAISLAESFADKETYSLPSDDFFFPMNSWPRTWAALGCDSFSDRSALSTPQFPKGPVDGFGDVTFAIPWSLWKYSSTSLFTLRL
jgi:hypothetical protein